MSAHDDTAMRAVTYLIETWDPKIPLHIHLGQNTAASMLRVEADGDGHVPRNARLTLAGIDMLAPYVQITEFRTAANAELSPSGSGGRELTIAAAPATSSLSVCTDGDNARNCGAHRAAYDAWLEPTSTAGWSEIDVGWDVGGGFDVESTFAAIGAWDARVPPSVFWDAWPISPMSETVQGKWEYTTVPTNPSHLHIDDAFIVSMRAYNLTAAEARHFGEYLFYWQRFADGRYSLADMPDGFVLAQTPVMTGKTRWGDVSGHSDGVHVDASKMPDLHQSPYKTRFTAKFFARSTSSGPQVRVDAAGANTAGTAPPAMSRVSALFAVPIAEVDKVSFARKPAEGTAPDIAPQSHWVNARTDAKWRKVGKEANGARVRGAHHAAALPLHIGLSEKRRAGAPSASSLPRNDPSATSTTTPSASSTPSASPTVAPPAASATSSMTPSGSVAPIVVLPSASNTAQPPSESNSPAPPPASASPSRSPPASRPSMPSAASSTAWWLSLVSPSGPSLFLLCIALGAVGIGAVSVMRAIRARHAAFVGLSGSGGHSSGQPTRYRDGEAVELTQVTVGAGSSGGFHDDDDDDGDDGDIGSSRGGTRAPANKSMPPARPMPPRVVGGGVKKPLGSRAAVLTAAVVDDDFSDDDGGDITASSASARAAAIERAARVQRAADARRSTALAAAAGRKADGAAAKSAIATKLSPAGEAKNDGWEWGADGGDDDFDFSDDDERESRRLVGGASAAAAVAASSTPPHAVSGATDSGTASKAKPKALVLGRKAKD